MRNFYYGMSFILINILFSGCATLHEAAKSGNLAVVKEKLNDGVDIHARDKYHLTALDWAASSGKLELVKYLVKNGADLKAKNKFGFTSFHHAAISGNLELIKYLIEKGADVNDKSEHGGNSLFYASPKGELEVIKYLVEKGAKVNIVGVLGFTSLQKAVHFGRLDTVKYLIEIGANINSRSKYFTMLNSAVRSGKLEVVKYLISKGADVLALDDSRTSALEVAYQLKNPEIIAYLKKESEKAKIVQEKNKIEQEKKFLKEKEKKRKKQEKEKKEKKQITVNNYILKNDFQGLKNYADKNPNAVYYIKDESIRLLLTGPKGLKVGDIRKHIKDGTDELIIVSLIKRVKEPYKEFSIDEIKTLQSMKLSSKIISTMMDVTTELLKDDTRRKQQKFFLSEQKRIKDQEIKVQKTIIYKNNPNQKVDSQGNPIVEKIQNELINQGAKMLFDKLF